MLEDLHNIESGGRYSNEELDVLSLHINDVASVEIHARRDNQSEVTVTGCKEELTVTLGSSGELNFNRDQS
ncbi:MAG: hypothetical protein ABEI77_05280 [Halorientalis sp.]